MSLQDGNEQSPVEVVTYSDDFLKITLRQQLQKMLERNGGQQRTDIKYIVLRNFIKRMETDSFQLAYSELPDNYKQAIITRLENETERLGGPLKYAFVKKLSDKLYGVDDDEGKTLAGINFSRKAYLEQLLQNENPPSM